MADESSHLIQEFKSITGLSDNESRSYLEANGWDVEVKNNAL